MNIGLKAFLKKIEATPQNKTFVERFIALTAEMPDSPDKINLLLDFLKVIAAHHPAEALEIAYGLYQKASTLKLTQQQIVRCLESMILSLRTSGKFGKAEVLSIEMEKILKSPDMPPTPSNMVDRMYEAEKEAMPIRLNHQPVPPPIAEISQASLPRVTVTPSPAKTANLSGSEGSMLKWVSDNERRLQDMAGRAEKKDNFKRLMERKATGGLTLAELNRFFWETFDLPQVEQMLHELGKMGDLPVLWASYLDELITGEKYRAALFRIRTTLHDTYDMRLHQVAWERLSEIWPMLGTDTFQWDPSKGLEPLRSKIFQQDKITLSKNTVV
ncbi:MAG: hypothetical protein AB7T49_06040 [Oligoflexales bacterium]